MNGTLVELRESGLTAMEATGASIDSKEMPIRMKHMSINLAVGRLLIMFAHALGRYLYESGFIFRKVLFGQLVNVHIYSSITRWTSFRIHRSERAQHSSIHASALLTI